MSSATPNYASRIIVFTCLAHGLTHVYMILFTPILVPMATDFGLELDRITAYYALCNVFFGLGAVPAGWLSDRYGEKIMLVLFFVGCAVGGAIVGLAESLWMLGLGCIALGLATSIFHPVGNALISKGLRHPGRAMGINGIAGSIGIAIGPLIAAGVHDRVGWRWAFIGLALPSLALGLALAFLSLGPSAVPSKAALSKMRAGTDPTRPRKSIAPNRLWLFICLLTAMTCGGFYFHLVTTLLPGHLAPETLRRGGGSVMGRGGELAFIVLACGALGQYVAGHFSERREPRGLYVMNLCLIAPLVFLTAHITNETLLLITACLMSTVLFGIQPIENVLLATHSPRDWRGRIFALKFVLAFAVGGTGSWVAGEIAEYYDRTGPVYDAAGVFVVVALIAAFVARQVPLPEPDPGPASGRRRVGD